MALASPHRTSSPRPPWWRGERGRGDGGPPHPARPAPAVRRSLATQVRTTNRLYPSLTSTYTINTNYIPKEKSVSIFRTPIL